METSTQSPPILDKHPQSGPNENGVPSSPPSAQAHEQSTPPSSEPDRDANPNGSHTVVSPDERDSAKAADKDKSSLAATTTTQPNVSLSNTTGTSTTRRFSRKPKPNRVAKSATPHADSTLDKSPPVRALSNGENKSKSGSPIKKESFISRLVRKLVPCVAANDRAHAVEIEPLSGSRIHTEHVNSASKPAEPVGTNEKRQLVEEEHDEEKRETVVLPPSQPPSDSAPLTGAQDNDVFPTPPTPPKAVLPPSESSAVAQPPAPVADIFSPPPVPHSDVSQPTSSSSHVHAGDVTHSTATDSDASFTDEDGHAEEVDEGDPMEEDDEDALIMNGGAGIPIGPDGSPRPLLPPIAPQHVGRKCLVLDLDETLVHSSFKSIQHADYVVPVEIEYHWHNVYVIKRPGVDNFLKRMGEIYEVVVFTASLSKYADPVLDKLDVHRVVSHRLFRESCYNHKGNYVKDLSQLGRPISDTIIIDNSPASYIFHPNNAVPVSSWFNDPHDTELTDLCPFLADLGEVPDVRGVLDGGL